MQHSRLRLDIPHLHLCFGVEMPRRRRIKVDRRIVWPKTHRWCAYLNHKALSPAATGCRNVEWTIRSTVSCECLLTKNNNEQGLSDFVSAAKEWPLAKRRHLLAVVPMICIASMKSHERLLEACVQTKLKNKRYEHTECINICA